jgi:hypothetical protein
MGVITTPEELREAIQDLERRKVIQEWLLVEQLNALSGSYAPGKLIRTTLGSVFSSPDVIENILGIAIGLGTGFLTKNIIVRTSVHTARKLGGSIFRYILSKRKEM